MTQSDPQRDAGTGSPPVDQKTDIRQLVRMVNPDDAYIIEHWFTTSRRVMTRHLGIARTTLWRRAARLGLAGTHRPWTESEDTLIRQQYAYWPPETIGRKLGRPPGAVIARARKLHVSGVTDDLSAQQCAAIIGRDARTVIGWITAGLLTARKRNGIYRVWPSVLRAFILEEQSRIAWRGVHRGGMTRELVGLLAGEWGLSEKDRRSSGHADGGE